MHELRCPACGSAVAPGRATCQTCSAAVAGEESGHPAAGADPPTQVLAAVAPPGATDAVDTGTSPDLPTTVVELPAVGQLPPAAEFPTTVVESPPAAGEHAADGGVSGAGRRQLVLAALLGGALVLAAGIGAWAASGGLAGFFGAPAPGSAAGTAGGDEPSGPPSTAQPDPGAEGFSCAPRELTAPASGHWRLYRAEWGSRGNFDYLRLKLRHEGQDEEPAALTAELLAPADVAARFGVEAPSDGDVALVVAFNGSVGIGASLDGRGDGPLRQFRVSRGLEDRVHAVVGVRGEGCFRLAGGSWEPGEMKSPTDITLEIHKP